MSIVLFDGAVWVGNRGAVCGVAAIAIVDIFLDILVGDFLVA